MICYEILKNLKFKQDEFNLFLQSVPEFFHHLFAFYDNKTCKWTKLNDSHFNSIKSIKFLPNVLFNNESTLNFVLHYLCSDLNIYRFFVNILIQEYQPSYLIEIFPYIIVLYQILMKKPNKSDTIKFLKDLVRLKEGYNRFLLMNSIMRSILIIVTDELMNKPIDELIRTLTKNMIKNINFQANYSRYMFAYLTLNYLQVNNDIFNWSDISHVTVNEKDNQFYIKLEINDLFSDLVIDLPMKNQAEAESIQFILLAQMNLVNYDHCPSMWQPYRPYSCIEQHWSIQQLLRDNQPHRLSMSLLDDGSMQNYMGDNFFINFIPLSTNKYACLKVLHKGSNLQAFWDIWFKYQEWRHPFILKCYGLFKKSCGFFRECADGPLFYNLYQNKQDFLFRHVLDVLNSIGSALDYLHRNLKQIHGNVNLKSIVKAGRNFKLSEASISETNSEVLETVKFFNVNLEEDKEKSPFITDLYGLLLSIVLIYFMNEKHLDLKVSQSSFLSMECQIKELILQGFKSLSQEPVRELLVNLYNISNNFTESILDEIIVQKNNKYIPKCIEIYIRDAKIFLLNEIKFSQLEIEKTSIGKGYFSTVFKAKYLPSKDCIIHVAAKLLNDKNNTTLDKIKTELLPSTFPQRNVLKSYGYCIDKEQIYLISELACSNLLTHLRSNQLQDLKTCINYCLQICEGMRFLSDERKFIHRDLAARNILVFKDKNLNITLKISDFGLTLKLKKNKDYYSSNGLGNRFWLPEDEFETGKFTAKSDIYSYGIVMWEIFTHGKEVQKIKKSQRNLPKEVDDIIINDDAYKIMESCWSKHRPKDFNSIIQSLKNLE